ncbi:hypothetical protein [Paenibacillus glycanilyticus]|uniref:Uncharacterized protein n=1 Tax=Paenibacillus glycanilyticus TaxID=126569 RepID=A0ABQ6G8G4_9BACL|nr:hypothetical protein [Paenibacillus glycanilyticus]GLX67254.1 hypothetical protein MU1_15990 [Paenibacillus glycanilyticus]
MNQRLIQELENRLKAITSERIEYENKLKSLREEESDLTQQLEILKGF